MKPKHRRHLLKERQPVVQQEAHIMTFDMELLTVLQASFPFMEGAFERCMATSHPRVPFALEMFQCVKQKVFDMLHAPGQVFHFDGNEMVIIRACVQMYSVTLLSMEITPERDYHLALCQQ